MVKIDHSQGTENSSPCGFLRNPKNFENDRYIIKDFFMEEKAEILEDYTHASSQLKNFMIRNPQDVSAIDDYLTASRIEFSEDDFEEGGLSWAAWTSDEIEISFFYMKGDVV